MPNAVRAAWIAALYPRANVRIPHDPPPNAERDAVHQAYLKQWLQKEGLDIDAVFSSEAYGESFARTLGADVTHRMVDNARAKIAVSGTKVRSDIHAHRAWLDARVYRHFVQRVVFLGAESTGKSTLTERAAADFETVCVPEIGRQVWEAKAGALCVDDYLEIARLHRQAEDDAILKAKRYMFSDTNALTTLLLGFCYGHIQHAPPELLTIADACATRYAHTFVCEDDIPFVQDGWRDSPAWRSRIQALVLQDLRNRKIPYTALRGSMEERLGRLHIALAAAPEVNQEAEGDRQII